MKFLAGLKKQSRFSKKKKQPFLFRGFRHAIIFLVLIVLSLSSFAEQTLALSPPFPATYWLHSEVSSLLANSDQLLDSAPDQVENTATQIKVKTSTTEWPFRPGSALTSNPGLVRGYGYVFDTPLNGQYDTGQTWNFYSRLRLTAGTAVTGVLKAYVYRYDGASTYTSLFSATSGSITPSSTATTYNWSYTTASNYDMAGQYLYVEYTWKTSSGGSTSTNLSFSSEGSGLAAADRPRIVPGASSIDALGFGLIGVAVLFFVFFMLKKKVLFFRRAVI